MTATIKLMLAQEMIRYGAAEEMTLFMAILGTIFYVEVPVMMLFEAEVITIS